MTKKDDLQEVTLSGDSERLNRHRIVECFDSRYCTLSYKSKADRVMPGSGKYLHVDVAISLKVLEQLIHLAAGMDRDSFFDLLSRSFCSTVRIWALSKGFSNTFLTKRAMTPPCV